MKKFRVVSIVLALAVVFTAMNAAAEPAEDGGISVTWEDAVLHTEITGLAEVDPEEETWSLSYETQYGPDCLKGYYTAEEGTVLTDGGNAGEFAEMAFAGIKPALDEALSDYIEPAVSFDVVWEDAVLHTEIAGLAEVDPDEETWALSYETQYGPDCLKGYYTVEAGVYDSVLTDGGNAGEFAEMAFAGIKPVLDEAIAANLKKTVSFDVVWEDAVLHTEIAGLAEVDPDEETWALSYETQYGPDCLKGYYTAEEGSVLTDGGNAGEFAEMAFAGIKPVLDEALAANVDMTAGDEATAVYNVTFVYNVEDYPEETYEIKEGTRLAVCENLGFQNYNQYHNGSWFAGWFADEALTTPYDKNRKADADVTLYAAWERSFPELTQMENSPLEGESIAALGSSVFAAASGVGEYIAIRFGADLIKEAASGTTLSEVFSNSYVERLKTMDTEKDFDLFLCQLSTNDATNQVPLGEISDGTNLEDFDTQTVTGALEYIIAYVQENWGCPFMLFIGSRYDSEEYAAMVERSKELAEKWGIGLSNLWDNEEVNSISDDLRAEYINEDGIHPTEKGYQEWWGPYMEAAVVDYLNSLK